MYGLSFDNINVILHGVKKSNSGHFDPYKVVIILSDIKSCSFSVVKVNN